jgi:hypothetical protein
MVGTDSGELEITYSAECADALLSPERAEVSVLTMAGLEFYATRLDAMANMPATRRVRIGDEVGAWLADSGLTIGGVEASASIRNDLTMTKIRFFNSRNGSDVYMDEDVADRTAMENIFSGLAILSARLESVERIGEIKRRAGIEVYNPKVEERMHEMARQHSDDQGLGLSRDEVYAYVNVNTRLAKIRQGSTS